MKKQLLISSGVGVLFVVIVLVKLFFGFHVCQLMDCLPQKEDVCSGKINFSLEPLCCVSCITYSEFFRQIVVYVMLPFKIGFILAYAVLYILSKKQII